MPVRQALNTVYAHVVSRLDRDQRKEFDDVLYGWSAMNQAGNDVLRDIRGIDEALTGDERGSEG